MGLLSDLDGADFHVGNSASRFEDRRSRGADLAQHLRTLYVFGYLTGGNDCIAMNPL
jgi:hypothetical protein